MTDPKPRTVGRPKSLHPTHKVSFRLSETNYAKLSAYPNRSEVVNRILSSAEWPDTPRP